MQIALLASGMPLALDIVAIVIIAVFALMSAKHGFVRCVFGMVSTLVAVIVAFALMKSFVRWTGGVFGLQTVIENGCVKSLSKIVGFDTYISVAGIEQTLAGKLPKFLVTAVAENVGKEGVPVGTTVAMSVGATIANFAVTLIAWILLFLLVKIILHFLERALSSVIDGIPVAGAVNIVLGMLLGVLQGLLLVSAVVAIFALIPTEGVVNFFNQTAFVRIFYHHNPIHVIFGWLIN